MKLYLLPVFFALINFKCTDAKIHYDEIQFSGNTDSSYIKIIIEQDSIIFYEIEQKKYLNQIDFKLGKKYSCHSIIENGLLFSDILRIELLLSDTFNPIRRGITDVPSNQLSILSKDSVLKKFVYYDMDDDNQILRDIGTKILRIVEARKKNPISCNSRLFDLSYIKFIDSVKVFNTRLYERILNDKMDTIYIRDKIIKLVKNDDSIINIIDKIQDLNIIISPSIGNTKIEFNEQYILDFYRNEFIVYSLGTDGKILSYSNLQWLKVDTIFMNLLK